MSVSPRTKPLSRPSGQRLPPPSLFQGPPSLNASSNSLLPNAAPQTANSQGTNNAQRPSFGRSRSSRPSVASTEGSRSLSPFLTRTQSHGDADSAELLWQEMQNTLAEVELNAMRGEHVFGEEHSKAMDELRTKQLKLAQAWARSEVDDEVVAADDHASKNNEDERPDAAGADAGGPGSTAKGTSDSTATYRALEAETEQDLQHARKRREANDRYFDRVNNGVLEVVARLEEVAGAMRVVEKESRDIWSDTTSESLDTPSMNG
ncbi:hypothetical protein VTN49DRAFT_1197 [Thermomyces lanuginosus]|uniref:uncharacterized protein n=1 Tax=Thermomyces lanuginosus TaxID=5541 RepID=UPI003741EA5D